MRTLDELGISPAPWSLTYLHNALCEECYCAEVIADDRSVITSFDIDRDQSSAKEALADARLIASAPMLYKALREAVIESCHECMEKEKCCPHKFDNGCFVTRWRDALAAASGESEAAK